MILADTSVWIDHFRAPDNVLVDLLKRTQVVIHPFVLGELASGGLPNRGALLDSLRDLPVSPTADDAEVLHVIHRHRLFGLGLSYIDIRPLAASRLRRGIGLWTGDKSLHEAAGRLGIAVHPVH